MKRILSVALGLAACLASADLLSAQAPATAQSQKPSPSQSSANPFPEDTSSVPVLPAKAASATPEGTTPEAESALPLPGEDLDPVHSPDDPPPPAADQQQKAFSSSLNGLEKLLPRPEDDENSGKKRKPALKEPTHGEVASKDIEVGSYYLQTRDWKGALSRFESALVLDPENPDVYWGLAEAERHMNHLADARAHYEKVVEYDPDGPHGKQAARALREPAIAHAESAPANQPALESPK